MSCYHPLKAIQYKTVLTEKGKGQIRILRKEEYEKEWSDDVEVLQLPCGKCIGCRIDYAQQWANRIMLEKECHDPETCYFLTLTFDDNAIECTGYEKTSDYGRSPNPHVRRPFCDPDTGMVIGWSHSLNRLDLQLFMKRFRRSHPNDRIRFFACGEYGDKSARPHYHLIVFGVHFDENDLSFLKKSPLGYNYMVSKSLSEDWPYGFNIVAPVTWESACYVARYVTKKMYGPDGKEFYGKYNLEIPFTQASRRPGIAAEYYATHPISEDTVSYVIGTGDGSRKFPPPRYLEKLFELDNPEGARSRRKVRQLSAINRQNLVLSRTGKSFDQYLADQEEKFSRNYRLLKEYRNIV